MNEADFLSLIRDYLKKRGWDEVEQALKQKAPETMLSNRLSIHQGVVESLMQHFSSGGTPESESEAYDKLLNWVDNSFDIYRVRDAR